MPGSNDVLPKDLMEMQLAQIDLLIAMYESDGSISMDEESSSTLNKMRAWCESDEEYPPSTTYDSISLLLTVKLDGEDGDTSTRYSLELDISAPLRFGSDSETDGQSAQELPKFKYRIRQPAWLRKAQTIRLSEVLQKDEDDVLSIIENVKDAAAELLSELLLEKDETIGNSLPVKSEPLVRIWFYFPSISTRAKRDDLINHAPTYGLTGFLLAGKPGILCLEGGSQAADDYMKFIKTESWGDIPPQHKKVSERHRETGTGITRLFPDMQEITSLVGERRGERANRNDMKALESWLEAKGIRSDIFARVLF